MNLARAVLAAPMLLARLAWIAAQRFALLLKVYRRFRVVLPAGAVIADADRIAIGRNFGISAGCHLYCQDPARGSELRIGDDVKLNVGVLIIADLGGRIRIGNDVLMAPYVVIRAANHCYSDASQIIRQQGHEAGEIEVGDDAWLGSGVVLLPGARVGKGAVIGAASVVTGEIPDYAVAVGAPARVIGQRGPLPS